MNCPHCSANVPADAAVCPVCGTRIESTGMGDTVQGQAATGSGNGLGDRVQAVGDGIQQTVDGVSAGWNQTKEQVGSLPGMGIARGFMDKRRQQKEEQEREAQARQAALDAARKAAFDFASQTCPLPLTLERIDLPGGLELFNDEFMAQIAKDWGITTKKLILTTHRLIHDKGLITKDQEVINLVDIRNINYHKTLMLHGNIEIETAGGHSMTDLPHAKNAKEVRNNLLALANWARSRQQTPAMPVSVPAAAPPAATAPAPPDRLEQLQKLASLKESGILTDEEFAQEKAKILEQG